MSLVLEKLKPYMVFVETEDLISIHLPEVPARPAEVIKPYSLQDYNKTLYFDEFGVQIPD